MKFDNYKDEAVAIIQARMSSSRLPGKVLAPLGGSSVLAHVVDAARAAHRVQRVVVATSTESSDDAVCEASELLGVPVVRGPLLDVLARFKLVSDIYPADCYVRLTADCPLVDPVMIDQCVGILITDKRVDLASNALIRTYPRGVDVEVIRYSALHSAHQAAHDHHRSHVTTWITDNPARYNVVGVVSGLNDSDLRVTVDTPEDLAVVQDIITSLGTAPHSACRVVDYLRANPAVVARNAHIHQKPQIET